MPKMSIKNDSLNVRVGARHATTGSTAEDDRGPAPVRTRNPAGTGPPWPVSWCRSRAVRLHAGHRACMPGTAPACRAPRLHAGQTSQRLGGRSTIWEYLPHKTEHLAYFAATGGDLGDVGCGENRNFPTSAGATAPAKIAAHMRPYGPCGDGWILRFRAVAGAAWKVEFAQVSATRRLVSQPVPRSTGDETNWLPNGPATTPITDFAGRVSARLPVKIIAPSRRRRLARVGGRGHRRGERIPQGSAAPVKSGMGTVGPPIPRTTCRRQSLVPAALSGWRRRSNALL